MIGQTLLIHHAAHRGCGHPASSLAALAECLAAGARVVEVDISPLADGDCAMIHEGRLEEVSDGQGPVAAATAAQVSALRYRTRSGALSGEPIALLSQVVALLSGPSTLQELQLDLKPHAPLTDAVLSGLLRRIEPIKPRVRVTCTADWALRRLAELDGELALGFDPLLYLDLEREEAGGTTPPLRTGAYGYLDEHPLAIRRWGSPAEYLASRAAALWAQAPASPPAPASLPARGASVWYIRATMLARCLDDGFDWVAWLHQRGAEVAAWTLDADQPHQLALARQMAALGVDRITSNDPPALARALGGGVVY